MTHPSVRHGLSPAPRAGRLRKIAGHPALAIAARLALSAALVGLATAALLWNAMFAQMPRLPSKDELWSLNRERAVEFQDAAGRTLAVRGPRYGRAIRLDELPDHVTKAFIAVEDKRFLDHSGVDYSAIFRAFLENVRAGRTVQGGSTITQQLVKNLFLTPDQTLKRKAQEARLAIELEAMLSKDEILELYLNRIYLGAGAYGLDAAAHTYFGAEPENLTLAEAAMLAAFPKAPSRFASAASTPAARERQTYVLDQMVEAGFVTRQQADLAAQQQLFLATDTPDLYSGHALDFAVEQAQLLLADPPADLVIQLTLDLELQQAAQQAIARRIADMGPGRNVSEGAAVVIDASGAIRAMVGGVSYADSKFNRAVQARRQPGSAFKMFVYAAALEEGLRPNSVRFDEPIRIGAWRPRNYEPGYRGAVTLGVALQESLNTVSAQIGAEIGVARIAALAHRFGIRSELHAYPSLALGSDEVTLLDLVTGYAVLPGGGLRPEPHIISRITNSRGEVLYQRAPSEGARVYQQELAEDMTGMLSRVVHSGTGRAARIEGWEIAGKTGTSQEWRDAWFIGYSARFTGGVWVGNDDDRPMNKVTGGLLPAAIWAEIMTVAHEGLEPVPLAGAKQPEEFLDPQTMARLSFYRRLASAFSMVEGRAQVAEAAPTL